MKFSLQVRRPGATDYGTLWDGYPSYEEAAVSRSRWAATYSPFANASFRILDPDGREVRHA